MRLMTLQANDSADIEVWFPVIDTWYPFRKLRSQCHLIDNIALRYCSVINTIIASPAF